MSVILLVDDSAFARSRVKATLIDAGHEVLEASSGQGCIDLLAENPSLGCVLLDLNMPGMDGFRVLERLQDIGSPVQVIVCTADTQDSTRKRCLALGAIGLINKPPKKDELLTAVQRLMDKETPQT